MDALELNGWIWLVWSSCWFLLAALGRRPNKLEERASDRLQHTLPTVLALSLIFFCPWSEPRLAFPAVLCNSVTGFGLLYTFCARYYLGTNWSGVVAIKTKHALVVEGPYRLTRHPIYTGLMVATLGSALAAGRFSALLGLALMLFTYRQKAKREEQFLREEFGDRYAQYAQTTPRLIPFFRRVRVNKVSSIGSHL